MRELLQLGVESLPRWGRPLLVVGLWAVLVLVVVKLSILQTVGAVLAIAAGIGLLVRPAYGLMGLLAARVWLDLLWFVEGTVFGLSVMETYGAVGTLGLIVIVLLRIDELGRHPALKWLLVFFAMATLAMLRAGPSSAGLYARMISPILVMFAVSTYVRDRRTAQLYLLACGAAAVVPVLQSTRSILTGSDYYFLAGAWRLSGGYHNATNHALMMTLFTCVGLFGTLTARTWAPRAVYGAFTALALAATYESYTRAAIIGLLIFGSAFLWFEGRRRLMLAAIPASVFALATSSVMRSRFANLLSSGEGISSNQDELGSGRSELWSSSLENFSARPLYDQILGMGLGEQFIAFTGFEPHNDYLAMLFQVGPVGMVSGFAVVAVSVYYARQAARQTTDPWIRSIANFSAALTLAVLPVSFITNGYYVRTSAGWYAFGIAGLGFGLALATRPAAAVEANPSRPPQNVIRRDPSVATARTVQPAPR
jgi:hypothetical protein